MVLTAYNAKLGDAKPLKGECMTENLNVLRSLVHIGDEKTLIFRCFLITCPVSTV